MRKPFFLILVLSLLCPSLFSITAQASKSTSITLYVSPSGNDLATGSRRHPLCTLDAALQKARALRSSRELTDTLFIELSEGTWALTRPILLTAEDSGTPQSPLVIRGQGMNSRTILSGGMQLTGFKQSEGNLWELDLSDVMPLGGDVPQLFVGGHRAVCARTPNDMEFFPTPKAKEWYIDTVPDRNAPRCGLAAVRIKVPAAAAEALQKAAPSPSALRVTLLHKWDLTRRSIQSFSVADSLIYYTGNPMSTWNRIDEEGQFFLENDRSFLDTPGEYFYDAAQKKLFYQPRPGEKLSDTAVIPSLTQLLCVKGDDNAPVEHVIFEDITFSHTRYDYPWQGYNPSQAAVQIDAALELDFVRNIHFFRCEVFHTGNWGLSFGNACRDNSVRECYLHDLGAGGLRMGTTFIPSDEEQLLTRGNVIDNNIIHEGGRVTPSGVGVILFQTSDNKVTHNDIADFYYTGISVGWVWGYAHSPSQRNDISYNHIHHIGWGLLSDMGGIYTLGDSHGTVVSHNYIHDIYSLGYGGWGLYTDEGTTGIRMEYNLVCRCKSSGFHQHYGKENLITNNIFVGNLRAQLEASRVEPDHLPFTFAHNILVYDRGNLYGSNWRAVNYQADENLYWNLSGPVTWNGASLAEWQQQTGKDLHSIIADPQFGNITDGDFTIGNAEAIRQIHFQPFDYRDAGVYGSDRWKGIAQIAPSRHQQYEAIVSRQEALRR